LGEETELGSAVLLKPVVVLELLDPTVMLAVTGIFAVLVRTSDVAVKTPAF
jgi:hypothetical protein